MKWRLCFVLCILAVSPALQVRAQQQPPQLDEWICPVSDNRFKKAQDIFAKIAEVLRHPRCINCHGAENPFHNGESHTGGTYELKKDQNGEVDQRATFAACQQCHGGLPDWRIPTSDMNFINLDSKGLCMLLKDHLSHGRSVIEHFKNDLGGTPFIAEAFKGTRGLKGQGLDMVDSNPAPVPSISRDDFVKLAKQWTDALGSGDGTIGDGDDKTSSTDCGCAPHHYALRIHTETTVAAGPVSADSKPNADPLVPLVFNDDRSFGSKQVSAVMPIKISMPLPCVAAGVSNMTLMASGHFQDLSEDKLFIKVGGTPLGTQTSVVCPPPLPSPQGKSIGNPESMDFVLDPFVGAQSPALSPPWFKPFPMVHSTISIAIVKVD